MNSSSYLTSIFVISLATTALSLSCSCQRSPARPDGEQADGIALDTSVVDAAIDEVDSTEPSDTFIEADTQKEVVGHDAPDIVGRVDTDGDTEPSQICAAVALPAPGEPCAEEGAVRCSNIEAVFNDLATFTGIGCYRPNVLRCKPSSDGHRWNLETCESITGYKSGVPPVAGGCANSVTCVIRSESDHGCQPVSISSPVSLKTTLPSKQTTILSHGHAFGGQWCSDLRKNPQLRPGAPPWCNGYAIVQCMPIEKSPFKDQVLAAAGDCAKYLLKGEWTFPVELCQVDTIYCAPKSKFCVLPGANDKAECYGYFHIGCNNEKTYQDPFYDPITNKLRCKKDCFEAGAPGYAPGESGVPGK